MLIDTLAVHGSLTTLERYDLGQRITPTSMNTP
jgi:hypothetical protein